MSNPSTVWAQLAVPNPARGSIPFVYTDDASIVTAVTQLWWNQSTNRLSVKCGGDQSGTDTINAYYQIDSYLAQADQTLISSSPLGATETAGFTVSTSRGTGSTPVISNTGDFIGKFSAWAYTGSTAAFKEFAGWNAYCIGATGSELGGELRVFTKQDNGSATEWFKVTNTGAIVPMSTGLVALGAANSGYSKLVLDFTASATAGNQTINKTAGSFKIAAGASSATITNSYVTSNSVVIAVLQTTDATATYCSRTVPTAGGFTVYLNANATAEVTIGFLVICTDS